MITKLKYGNTNTFFVRGTVSNHSNDSISLILDSRHCFVGDLEPIEYLGGYEQNEVLKSDWETIMRYAPKVIYYAHANEKIL